MRHPRPVVLRLAVGVVCAVIIASATACSGGSTASVTTIDTTDAATLFNQGVALQDAGDLAAAIELYDRAIAVDAQLGAAWYNRAVAKQGLGRVDEAIEDYRRAIELEPRNARALYNLGNLLIARGDTDDGVTMVMQATEIDPSLRGDGSPAS